jgi:sulfur relay protein TusC/DsrF
MVKGVLLVIKSPPYGSGRAAEGLRMATAMIAMDVLPKMLFIDHGVYCLLKNQKPESAGLKPFSERLKTIADLVGLHASSDSLMRRKLESEDIDDDLKVKTLNLQEMAQLFSQNKATITF